VAQAASPSPKGSLEERRDETRPARLPIDWESLAQGTRDLLVEIGGAAEAEERRVELRKKEAGKWLELIDKGAYETACTRIPDYLLTAGDDTVDDCAKLLRRTRTELGRMRARTHVSTQRRSVRRDLAITFETVFKKKKACEIFIAEIESLLPLEVVAYSAVSSEGTVVAEVLAPTE
jgi:hypothetical protein